MNAENKSDLLNALAEALADSTNYINELLTIESLIGTRIANNSAVQAEKNCLLLRRFTKESKTHEIEQVIDALSRMSGETIRDAVRLLEDYRDTQSLP